MVGGILIKIYDRVVLGIISGSVGNFSKSTVSKILMGFVFGEKSGSARALGMFLPKYKLINQCPKRKLIAFISDYTVAGMLGVYIRMYYLQLEKIIIG